MVIEKKCARCNDAPREPGHSHCRPCKRLYGREYRASHPDIETRPSQIARRVRFRERHRERLNKEARDYQRANSECKLAQRRQEKETVFRHYGGVCTCCNENLLSLLTIDHINDDGGIQRKKNGKGGKFYAWIIKMGFPTDLQILCWSCNTGRHFNGGVCPHETERLRLVA